MELKLEISVADGSDIGVKLNGQPLTMPKPPAPRGAREPKKRVSPQMTEAEFRASRNEVTVQLITYLERHLRVSKAALEEHLGVPGKSLGGLVGALNKWAESCGLQAPVKIADPDVSGENRTYVWYGFQHHSLSTTPVPPPAAALNF